MRDGWTTAALGSVCEVLDRKRKPITKRDRTPGPYPYYGASGVLDHVDCWLFDEPLVLVGEDGAKWGAGDNTAFRVSGKCWVNNHAHVLKPDRAKALDAWLVYYLNFSDLSPFISGLTVPKLNQGMMNEIPIPLPPLAEQERIVAILDEAFEAIATATANTEKNSANARELFHRELDRLFAQRDGGWQDTTINDIAQVKGGKRVPKGYKLQDKPTDHPYITVSDFDDRGGIDASKIRYVSDAVHDQIKRYIITPRDVYLSIAGTIGRSGIVPPELDGANLTENACRLVLADGVDNRFVYYFTRTTQFRLQAASQTRVAAQPKLALSRLKTIRLAIPPAAVQREVVQECDKLSQRTQSLESLCRRKQAALAQLRQSILNQAFSGELTAVDRELSDVGA